MDSIFAEISLLLALGTGIAIVMRLLKQPLIIGHIFTGILVGPAILGIVHTPETIEVFGSFGIALLLFIVGLGLNPKVIKEVGRVSLLTGLGQVLFTTIIGFFIVRFYGYSPVSAFYIAVALAFSSTIIILKLLTDKKEHNKLYGKISIGFLLVQDLIATVALLIASTVGTSGLSYKHLGMLSLKGAGLIILVFAASRFIVRPIAAFLARSQELLFLFAIAWGFGIATVFLELGFSLEVGALVAGIGLSTMDYAQEIGARLRPLRDFFIVVFFIALGAKLNIADIGSVLSQAIGLSIFVLVGNPIIVMIIMGLLGYTKRTSFKAGLAVAQISEFSLIFMLVGQRNGQIAPQAVSLITIIAIITIAASSYMIIYADTLYKFFEKYLSLFERRKVKYEQTSSHSYEAVLFGYQRGGDEFVKAFKGITKKFVVVDYDPDMIDQLERKEIPFLYGDATDAELLEEIGFEHTRLVISTMSDHQTNTFLLQHAEKVNPNLVIICYADSPEEAAELYELGASYVMVPYYIGSEKVSAFIKKNGFNKVEFRNFREKNIAYLQAHYGAEAEPPSAA